MLRAPGAMTLSRGHFLGRGNGSFSPASFRMPFLKSKGTSLWRDAGRKGLAFPAGAGASASCAELGLTKQNGGAGARLWKHAPLHAYKERRKKKK